MQVCQPAGALEWEGLVTPTDAYKKNKKTPENRETHRAREGKGIAQKTQKPRHHHKNNVFLKETRY